MKNEIIFGVLGLIIFLIIWLFSAVLSSDSGLLPSPFKTLISIIQLLKEGYWLDLFATVVRTVVAWLLAIFLAIPCGLIQGIYKNIGSTIRPVWAFLRAMPAFMLITIPLAFKIKGELAVILVIIFAVFLIIAEQCADAVKNISQDKIDALRSLGGGIKFRIRKLYIWEILANSIAPSARANIGLAFIVSVVVETLVLTKYGIGTRLVGFINNSSDISAAFGLLVLTGLCGVILNILTWIVFKGLIFWQFDGEK